MQTTTLEPKTKAARTDWIQVARELGPRFAARAAAGDAQDAFVAENYAELKTKKAFSAGVPAELGGGGATHAEVCAFVRTLAQYCGATALAYSMHAHLVGVAAWRWRNEGAKTDGLLRKVAAEELVLVSSGGSDWLAGSGVAERVEGGYRIRARKVFSSGSPAGDLLVTSAVYTDPEDGPMVLHFPVPLRGDGVRLVDTWRAMGMRGTGSGDVLVEGVFVPDAAVGVKRPAGRWHPVMHCVAMIAFPLIYSAYVGLAEAARDVAVRECAKRREDPATIAAVGLMETELHAARIALGDMVETAATSKPGPATTTRISTGRVLAGRAALRTAERALEAAGGAAFRRELPLERIFRDVQAARFHPLGEKVQVGYAGRLALGLELDG
jgi:acyl-CoA dehydrogenase